MIVQRNSNEIQLLCTNHITKHVLWIRNNSWMLTKLLQEWNRIDAKSTAIAVTWEVLQTTSVLALAQAKANCNEQTNRFLVRKWEMQFFRFIAYYGVGLPVLKSYLKKSKEALLNEYQKSMAQMAPVWSKMTPFMQQIAKCWLALQACGHVLPAVLHQMQPPHSVNNTQGPQDVAAVFLSKSDS